MSGAFWVFFVNAGDEIVINSIDLSIVEVGEGRNSAGGIHFLHAAA